MEWVVRETRRRRRVGKKRCRKALSRERDPLTKVRWAHVTKLPLHLASEQPHPYTLLRTTRDGDDVLLLPSLWSKKNFPPNSRYLASRR